MLLVFADAYMNPRTGIMYLASSLKANGHEVRIVNAGKVGLKGLRQHAEEWKPRVIGYTAMTGEHIRLLELSRELKRDVPVMAVFGGPHATFCPEELLNDPGCDAACVGEGEVAFSEFCRRLEAGEAWWQSPNFVVKHDDVVIRNPLLPLLDDLDSLPMPDHDLMYEADPALAREGVKIFYSARDCPCLCTYCFHTAYRRLYRGASAAMRQRSPERFVDEMCRVKEHYPLTHVVINDDSFLLNPPDWFARFCSDYKTRIGLPFTCCVRENLVTEPLIAQLCDAGLSVAVMGIECGNEDVANDVLKRGQSKGQIRRAAEIIKRHGLFLVTLNLCGLPVPNSFAVDKETLMFNVELAPDWAWSSLLYPYPGTEIRTYAQEQGLLPKEHVPLLQTNKRSSVFSFSSPREKRQIENQHKLFDLLVRHPWLRKHSDFLCALPLDSLYRVVWYVRYGYFWKFKMFPFTSPLTEIWQFLAILAKLLRQS